MLSLIQWEMWLGDQMLPIYPRLAGWFYFYACFKRHTILPLIRKLPIRKKILIYFQRAKRWLQKPQCLNNKGLKGLGGGSIRKMPLWEHKGLTLDTQRPNKKTGTVACAWGRSDRTIPKATMTSQSSSTHQLQGQWQILSPKLGWRVTKTPTLAMHVHTHLSTLTQMHTHRKEKWPGFRFNHIPIQLTKKQSRNFHLSLKLSSSS